MAVVLSDDKKKALEYVAQVKEKGLLPTRYAKELNLRYPHFKVKTIHNVVHGQTYNAEIIDAIIELASENKEKQRLEKLEALLKDD